ncbi:MAG: hypothetical protein M3425_08770, partial [Actinomycetota bacterium]|nr:hypothetical protein [Actinomycetota bacterium]
MDPADSGQPTPFMRDESDRPVFRLSLVLFLDVLGASNLANGPLHEAEAVMSKLDGAIREGRRYTTDSLDRPEFIASWFSDNLVLASPFHTDHGESEFGTFLHVTGLVQLHLALAGFFTRG